MQAEFKMEYRSIKTDVLVVGGGGAAVYAALSAAKNNSKVILVSKGKVGKSGNTIMVGGDLGMDGQSAFDLGEPTADQAFTKQMSFEKIVKESFHLADQEIVEQFCDYAPSCVKDLVDMGRTINAQFDFYPPGAYVCNGKELGLTLRKFLKNHPNVDMQEDIRIVDLIKIGEKVVGALGIDIFTGKYSVYQAKAVIIATGGYQPYALKCTEESASNGDGMAMAYRVGAKLRDMEFLLSIPAAFVTPKHHRGSIFPYLYVAMTNQYRLTDKNQNVIPIPKKMQHMNETSEMNKIIINYYTNQALFQGLATSHGGFYIDFKEIPQAKVVEGFDIIKSFFKDGKDKADTTTFKYSGEDFEDMKQVAMNGGKWEVNTSSEYSMGGILIDASMRTTVSGLYAAGEASSGCFGALRIADGLTEMLVQGRKAGETAAKDIHTMDNVNIPSDTIQELIQNYEGLFDNTDGLSPVKIREEIHRIADSGFGPYRDQQSMEHSLEALDALMSRMKKGIKLASHHRKYNFEWDEAISVQNLVICLEAGLRSALMRTESRGTHMRSDYPKVDHDHWLVNIVMHEENGKMISAKLKPTVTQLQPPTGSVLDIMEYVLEIDKEFGEIEILN